MSASDYLRDVTPEQAEELERLATERDRASRLGPERAERWLRGELATWERGDLHSVLDVLARRPADATFDVGALIEALNRLCRDQTLLRFGGPGDTSVARR